ncbi:hypothetical protein HaLaN_29504, partial [Haematococcus lacustris]
KPTPGNQNDAASQPRGFYFSFAHHWIEDSVPMQQTLPKAVHFVVSTCMKITNPMLGTPDSETEAAAVEAALELSWAIAIGVQTQLFSPLVPHMGLHLTQTTRDH